MGAPATLAALVLGGALAAPGTALAQPLRLRADALAAAESPVAIVNLEADAEPVPWLRAEAVLWLGNTGDGAGSDGDGAGSAGTGDGAGGDGDALIIDVMARRADGRAAARLGRMIAAVGALRPLHLDGGWGRADLPWQLQVEGFAGVPVAEGAQGRGFDWLAGGRLGRRLGDFGGAGVAYLQQRDHGALATEELALDAGAALGRRSDAAARLSLDLIRFGVAEAQLAAATRRGRWRGELHLSQRDASHLLPATSLFSVLGDAAAQRAGAVLGVRAAPRLELTGELGGRRAGGELAGEATLRARLWLGDRRPAPAPRGDGQARPAEVGALGLELRRSGGAAGEGSGGWTGARASARLPLAAAAGGALGAAAELELVAPDDGGRGAVWPWALAAVTWRRACWEGAIAVEASASPEQASRLDVLARVSRRWEAP